MMLSKKWVKLIFFSITLTALNISFVNCSVKGFQTNELKFASTASGDLASATPVVTRTPDPKANIKLLAIPENTALDLGGYSCNQPTDTGSCRAAIDYSRITYDPTYHEILMWGGGHGSELQTSIDAFNIDTLVWKPHADSTLCKDMSVENLDMRGFWKTTGQPLARHTWDMSFITEVKGRSTFMILTGGGFGGSTNIESCGQGVNTKLPDTNSLNATTYFYDLETKVWRAGSIPNETRWYYASSAEVDPISKKVIVTNYNNTSVYDPETDQVIATFGGTPGYSNNLIYFPPTDKMYYVLRGNPTEIYELTLNRTNWAASTWKSVNAAGPATVESGWAYDSVNQVIGGGVFNDEIYIYKPLTNSWETKKMMIQSDVGTTSIGRIPESGHTLDFSPLEGVFIFYTANSRTWAYRYK